MNTKLVFALDAFDLFALASRNWEMYEALAPHVDVWKVSLPFLVSCMQNSENAERFFHNNRIFFDFKLHDIPYQMEMSVQALARYEPELVTIHSVSTKKGMHATYQRLRGLNDTTKLIAVTVLTSMDEESWREVGKTTPVVAAAHRLAHDAWDVGVDGIVCSNDHAASLKKCYPGMLTVVPGFRFCSPNHDQERTVTASTFDTKNVDYLVVGRTVSDLKEIDRMAARLEEIQVFLKGTGPRP